MRDVDRTGQLLHLLMGLSTFAAVVWCALLVVEVGASVRAVAFGLLVVVVVGCWLLLQPVAGPPAGTRRRVAAAVFVVLGIAAPFVGDGTFTLPLVIMALLVAASAFGPRVAGALVLVGLAGQLITSAVVGHGLVDGVLQLVATAFVLVFGLALAWLTAEHERQRREIEELLQQARRGASAEAELVLADERTRAARDLHDGLGHRLTVINLALVFAGRMLDRDPGRAREQIERARTEAAEALGTMRRWVRALSPVRTEGADLSSTLDAIAESFRGTGLQVDVSTDLPPGRSPEQPVVALCYRVVQEGLTNALRHAQAQRVQVTARADEHTLQVSVVDDGRGGEGDPAVGFGLHTLRQRAAQHGGTVEAHASPDGWTLVATLPMVVASGAPGRSAPGAGMSVPGVPA